MLFDYLERHEPGVLYALDPSNQRWPDGRPTTSLIAGLLLELTGKSVSDLEEAYESYARVAGGG